MRNTLLGSEYSRQEILPDTAGKNDSVKIKPETDDSKELTEQLDLSVAPCLSNFEEETEDDDDHIF